MQLPSIQQLLAQKMDRKQFLKTIGLIILVAIGLSFLLKQERHASPAGRTTSGDTYGG